MFDYVITFLITYLFIYLFIYFTTLNGEKKGMGLLLTSLERRYAKGWFSSVTEVKMTDIFACGDIWCSDRFGFMFELVYLQII